MQITTRSNETTFTLALQGRFDFHSHRDFRESYQSALEKTGTREIEVDFRDVDYLDSSALGMLLLLREKADAVGKIVILANMRGMVKQVLDVANFGKLFNMKG